MKEVTVTIPGAVFTLDAVAIARDVLERAALEAYKTDVISLGRLADILGFSIDEAYGFLKAKETPARISFEDIEHGFEALDALPHHQ